MERSGYSFSVVMAVYNVEPFLRDAVESLVSQDIGFENIHPVAYRRPQNERVGVGCGYDMPVAERDDVGLKRLREPDNHWQNAFWEQEVAEDFIVLTIDDFTTVITDEETTELMETQAFGNMTGTVGGAAGAESDCQSFLLRMNQRVG